MNTLPKGGVTAMAQRLGISAVYLHQIAARQAGREAPPKLCVRIEEDTVGQVRRWDLKPSDWRAIWPELRDHPEAPADDLADGAPADDLVEQPAPAAEPRAA